MKIIFKITVEVSITAHIKGHLQMLSTVHAFRSPTAQEIISLIFHKGKLRLREGK